MFAIKLTSWPISGSLMDWKILRRTILIRSGFMMCKMMAFHWMINALVENSVEIERVLTAQDKACVEVY